MSISIIETPASSNTKIPVAPTKASSTEVATYAANVQALVQSLAALPHSEQNDEAYLAASSAVETEWVPTSQLKLRVLEAIGITAAVSVALVELFTKL